MMRAMSELRLQQHFIDSADLHYQWAQTLAKPLDAAVQALLACWTGGGKVLVGAQGRSAPLAMALAGLLLGGHERERPPLSALALPTEALARSVQALGEGGDVLVLFLDTAQEAWAPLAVQAAHERDMTVLAFTGSDGGLGAQALRETDVHVRVPHERPARVREAQWLMLHALCDAIDALLLGEQESL